MSFYSVAVFCLLLVKFSLAKRSPTKQNITIIVIDQNLSIFGKDALVNAIQHTNHIMWNSNAFVYANCFPFPLVISVFVIRACLFTAIVAILLVLIWNEQNELIIFNAGHKEWIAWRGGATRREETKFGRTSWPPRLTAPIRLAELLLDWIG